MKTTRIDQDGLASRVLQARNGEAAERNRLIEDYRPFVAGIVRKMLGATLPEQGSVEISRRDEFSVGLMGFNEAIDRYLPATGVPFLSFAGLVINRRLVDWFRHESNARSTYRFSELEEDGETSYADRLAAPERNLLAEMETEEEIRILLRRLDELGLSLSRLQRKFPRHGDSRLLCVRIARLLKEDPELMAGLGRTRRLPCADLSVRSGTPVKTIEKNRGSIILVALMMDSGLDVIKGYLKKLEEGSK